MATAKRKVAKKKATPKSKKWSTNVRSLRSALEQVMKEDGGAFVVRSPLAPKPRRSRKKSSRSQYSGVYLNEIQHYAQVIAEETARRSMQLSDAEIAYIWETLVGLYQTMNTNERFA
jgi:hypothetical protein